MSTMLSSLTIFIQVRMILYISRNKWTEFHIRYFYANSNCVDTVDGPGRDPELRPFSNRSRSLMIFMTKNPNSSVNEIYQYILIAPKNLKNHLVQKCTLMIIMAVSLKVPNNLSFPNLCFNKTMHTKKHMGRMIFNNISFLKFSLTVLNKFLERFVGSVTVTTDLWCICINFKPWVSLNTIVLWEGHNILVYSIY